MHWVSQTPKRDCRHPTVSAGIYTMPAEVIVTRRLCTVLVHMLKQTRLQSFNRASRVGRHTHLSCPPYQPAAGCLSLATPSAPSDHVDPSELRHASSSHASSSQPSPQQQPSQRKFVHLKLDLPPAVNSRVKKAVFVKSSASVKECPPDRHPEFALIGRSNVGKSSLINVLAEQDKLARVSREPGMTKLINHYLINDSWYMVDLPGYGFAKTASKSSRDSWLRFTKNFFINRNHLVHVLLLVDSSVEPQQIDLDCAQWLAECEVPFAIAFTKMDITRKKKDQVPSCTRNVNSFKEKLAEEWEELPWCFETSSKTGLGRSELQAYMASLRDLHLTSCG